MIYNKLYDIAQWDDSDTKAKLAFRLLNLISKKRHYYCWDCDGALVNESCGENCDLNDII